MLTRNHRQEGLSRAYVRAIAAQAGLLVCSSENDYGIDLSLRVVEKGTPHDIPQPLDRPAHRPAPAGPS